MYIAVYVRPNKRDSHNIYTCVRWAEAIRENTREYKKKKKKRYIVNKGSKDRKREREAKESRGLEMASNYPARNDIGDKKY